MPGVRCRQIEESDCEAVAALLARGFVSRPAQFWLDGMAQLAQHQPPPGLPKYGYLIESGGEPVGAILVICSAVPGDNQAPARCNLSSWYVEPAFRPYAPFLVSHALRRKDITYLNVSAAPHTWPIIEAQGFSRYSDGIFVAIPALSGLFGGEQIKIFGAEQRPGVPFEASDQDILRQHAAYGCISLWCATAERAYPFVLGPRRIRRIIPSAQLIYCGSVPDFIRFAGPIGRHLMLRGIPFVIIDANAPIPGLAGIYRAGSRPKYFKGPQRPRLGDLAYTEYALLGI